MLKMTDFRNIMKAQYYNFFVKPEDVALAIFSINNASLMYLILC
jgi:hypothetical protein